MRTRATRYLIAMAAAAPLALATAPAHAATATPIAPLTMAAAGHGISGQYVVTLKKDASINATTSRSHVSTLQRYGTVINGFSAKLSPTQLSSLRSNPNVTAIEQDQVFSVDTTQSNPPSWGLDRIDQRDLPLSNSYTFTSNGAGVFAYVIDTGISTTHPDFGGRAAVAFDALGGNGQDCNGHGTHVAGTVGGSSFGVAKGVQLRAVRVLNCSGSGTLSQVISGMNFVAANHSNPAVANMSLGGGFSTTINDAANNLANSGVFLAVAAGNENQDACNTSPASAANVTSVMASDINDNRASFSNFGSCTDLYAPGVSITSDWLRGTTNTISGTSMATPHVTGVGALYKATFGNASFSTIRSFLTTNASSGKIRGNPAGSPNLLLFKSTL